MKRMAIVLFTVVRGLSQPVHVTLSTSETKVNLTLGDVLHTVHGNFKLTKGEMWFDPVNGKAGGLLVVDAASGRTGNHVRDDRMHGSILRTDKYADISFTPDRVDGKVNLSGASTFQLHGTFSIFGATHELTMNVNAHISGDRLTAAAGFDVPYVRWGLKNPSTLFLRVNEIVQIDIQGVGLVTREAGS